MVDTPRVLAPVAPAKVSISQALTLTRPRVRADLHVERDHADRVFFLGENRTFYVDGPVVSALLPLLDGTRDVADIAIALRTTAPFAAVVRELARLEQLGALVEGPADDDPATTAWRDALGLPTSQPAVTLHGFGDVKLDALRAGLLAAGIEVSAAGDDAGGLTVAVTDDHLRLGLGELNRRMLAAGQPWLVVKPAGAGLWLGPLFVPGDTGCWQCLASRMTANRQIETYFRDVRGTDEPLVTSVAASPASLQLASGLLATEIALAVNDLGASPLRGAIAVVDVRNLEITMHQLTRRPQCPVCGRPDDSPAGTARPVRLMPRAVLPGHHRICTAEQTLDRLAPQVSPVTGLVTALIPLATGEDGPTYTYAAAHSFGIIGHRFDTLVRNLRGALSGGKGRTDVQARTGAVCEAIERTCAVWRGDENRRHAAWVDLADGGAADPVHPTEILNFSEYQYDHAEELNDELESRFAYIPERFDEARPTDWTGAWSLTRERPRLVPTLFCYYGHPDAIDNHFCVCDSNGSASGNCLEEAIVQGLYELVERDSVALWWYNRANVPALDLDMGDPYLDGLREYYASVDRDLWALDLTADTGIPTYAVLSRRTDHPVEDVIVGFGAHLDPRAAFDRAVDELNQFLPSLAYRNPDGSTLYWGMDDEARSWWRDATLASEPYLLPRDDVAPTRIGDVADQSSSDLAEDVRTVVARLDRLGLETLVVDQSRPDVDLAIAKVIVPGIRHFWRRLGPGRLYDVPVKLGWVDSPRDESELNPKTIFF